MRNSRTIRVNDVTTESVPYMLQQAGCAAIQTVLRQARKRQKSTGRVIAARAFFRQGGDQPSSVLVSPTGWPMACALSRRRMILPLRVLGRLGTNSILAGTAIGPTSWRT